MKKHKCQYESDGGECTICRKTVADSFSTDDKSDRKCGSIKLHPDGTTTHYSEDGTEIGSTGSISLKPSKYKSWIEGFKYDIKIIENEIRKYCQTNNLTIIELRSEKSSWLRKTCYFDIEGDVSKLKILNKYILDLIE